MKTMTCNSFRKFVLSTTSALVLCVPFSASMADEKYRRGDRFTVYADVIRAEPIYRSVTIKEPTTQCWTEQERYLISESQPYRENNTSHYRSHSGGDALIGGVIGGVVGNQLGRNGSRSARAGATVAGAIIGSVIGNEARGGNHNQSESNRRHRRHTQERNKRHRQNHNTKHHLKHSSSQPVYGVRPVERCQQVINNRVEQRIEGYNVTYIHRGRRLQTQTRKDPGSKIQLSVRVEPVTGQ